MIEFSILNRSHKIQCQWSEKAMWTSSLHSPSVGFRPFIHLLASAHLWLFNPTPIIFPFPSPSTPSLNKHSCFRRSHMILDFDSLSYGYLNTHIWTFEHIWRRYHTPILPRHIGGWSKKRDSIHWTYKSPAMVHPRPELAEQVTGPPFKTNAFLASVHALSVNNWPKTVGYRTVIEVRARKDQRGSKTPCIRCVGGQCEECERMQIIWLFIFYLIFTKESRCPLICGRCGQGLMGSLKSPRKGSTSILNDRLCTTSGLPWSACFSIITSSTRSDTYIGSATTAKLRCHREILTETSCFGRRVNRTYFVTHHMPRGCWLEMYSSRDGGDSFNYNLNATTQQQLSWNICHIWPWKMCFSWRRFKRACLTYRRQVKGLFPRLLQRSTFMTSHSASPTRQYSYTEPLSTTRLPLLIYSMVSYANDSTWRISIYEA